MPSPVLVVVEGTRDADFLKRISAFLHDHDPLLPDLQQLEETGQLIFVPCGGSTLREWAFRFASLHQPEFHLYDRELPPVTQDRERLAGLINQRPNCIARVTSKRALENYLHPDAVQEATDICIGINDECNVAYLLARAVHRVIEEKPWEELARQGRKKLLWRAKKILNTTAVDRMTVEQLAARDPDGEVACWLRDIARLQGGLSR